MGCAIKNLVFSACNSLILRKAFRGTAKCVLMSVSYVRNRHKESRFPVLVYAAIMKTTPDVEPPIVAQSLMLENTPTTDCGTYLVITIMLLNGKEAEVFLGTQVFSTGRSVKKGVDRPLD